MSRPLTPLLAILVLGAFAQIAQAVLIREGLVVFYGNEVSLGAFYGSWLLWLAVGAAAALGWEARRGPGGEGAADGGAAAAGAALRLILCALPLVLAVQVLGLRSVRWFLDVSASEFVPLGDLFLALTLVNLPGGVLLGLAFALTCRAIEVREGAHPAGAVGLVARTYVADALGALLGGVLFTFVLIRTLGPVATLGLVSTVLALTAATLPRPRGGAWRWLPWCLALAGLVLALPPIARPLELTLEQWRFAHLRPGMDLLDSVETAYGHVAVARRGQQTSVVADGQVHQSFPLPLEVERQAAYFLAQVQPRPRTGGRVLILGGYAGGLAAGLLRYPLARVDQVEQDPIAFARVRPFLAAPDRAALADPRLTLHFADGRRFLRRLEPGTTYDLILSLDATPAAAAGNRLFTREAFALARARLAPGGAFCTQVSAASNYVGSAVGGYAGSVYRTLQAVFATVVMVPGDPQVLCAGDPPGQLTEDPAELQRRYLATDLPDPPLPPGTFATLLPAQEVAFLHAKLAAATAPGPAPAQINTDARPVTYYLNMVLWGQFSGSGFVDWLGRVQRLGPWPYLAPALLFVALWLVRALLGGSGRRAQGRTAGVFALAVVGFVAMAGQLALLFSYQAQVGLVFERIALFNGLFMAGLALGGAAARPLASGPRADLALMGQLAAVAAGLLLLPLTLAGLATLEEGAREAGYLALTLALGLLAGAGFTLCVGLGLGLDLNRGPDGSALRGGALAMAADSLGGALGGLVTGALMVPILGVDWTCRVLAGSAVLALVPLGVARLLPPSAAGPRAAPSFPWPGLGWGLTYGVLLVYAWSLSQWQTAPEPQVRFDQERLAQVSGSADFRLADSPFVHYLGRTAGASAPETVTLASAATGPGVSGFAGPVEVLLAVDRDGVLRGVQYLSSRETPSYIAAIETWLSALRGADLAQGPLSLERVDGLSGATLTSRAVLETINTAAQKATQAAFGQAVPPTAAGPEDEGPDWGFYATALLLAIFFPVYLYGGERARLLFQGLALVVLGFWLNTLVTEMDLVQLSQGQTAALWQNPRRLLLLGFVLVSSLLFGQVWCGYLCPFGALQEFSSRLGRRLGLRSYPRRPVEQAARYLKFLLLAAVLVLVWTTGETAWATFNPMQHSFGGRLGGWMLGLTGAVLAASLVYYRFWCRYLCPLGAFLALGNKLALLQRLAPPRRFGHCDLGVKGEYDLDCIRCQRCRSGLDTRKGVGASRPGAFAVRGGTPRLPWHKVFEKTS